MKSMSKAKILRFYISSTDVVKHTSVYETLAFEAKKYGLAGATVYKGVMGYGTSSNLHSDKFWEINYKIPVVVEIIDEEEKINHFLEVVLPWIDLLPKGCLITCQDTTVVLVKNGKKK
jgi:uncharacterized protein